MIQLMHKKLYPENMEILYDRPFSKESLEEDFEIKGGKWYVDDEGWLCGENRENCAAMVISKGDYFGDVLMEVDCATILPNDHDINVMWHGSWNLETNKRHVAYVAGIQGWWDGKVGFERSPEYTFTAGTQLFPFEPGRVYHFLVGDIKGHIFICIDDKLVLEITDNNPIDGNVYGKIGFEAYCSKLKFKNVKIRRVTYEPDSKRYEPKF